MKNSTFNAVLTAPCAVAQIKRHLIFTTTLLLMLITTSISIHGQNYARIVEDMYAKYSKVTDEQIEKWEEKADILFEKGKYLKAMTYYSDAQMAWQTKGRIRTDIQYKAALCLENINKFDEAISIYKSLLLLEPSNNTYAIAVERAKASQELYQIETAQKKQRTSDIANTLNSVGNLLVDAANVIPDNGNNAIQTQNNSIIHEKDMDTDNSQHNASEIQAMQTDRRTYSNWESQLIKMNTYYESEYNNAQRKHIQRQMKSIREKWEKRGFNMFHSTWEDWDGKKK